MYSLRVDHLAASRRQIWADEVEEELFVEEMIVSRDSCPSLFAPYTLRDSKVTEEEEETAPVAVEKPASIIESLRAGIMNAVSILEENVIEIDFAVKMAQDIEAVAVGAVSNTVSLLEENIMDIDLDAEMAEADTAFYYDESVSFDTMAAAR